MHKQPILDEIADFNLYAVWQLSFFKAHPHNYDQALTVLFPKNYFQAANDDTDQKPKGTYLAIQMLLKADSHSQTFAIL